MRDSGDCCVVHSFDSFLILPSNMHLKGYTFLRVRPNRGDLQVSYCGKVSPCNQILQME